MLFDMVLTQKKFFKQIHKCDGVQKFQRVYYIEKFYINVLILEAERPKRTVSRVQSHADSKTFSIKLGTYLY